MASPTYRVNAHTTVGDLVGRFPQTRKVFQQRGIDYCCGGAQSLAQAAIAAGLELLVLMSAVEEAMQSTPSDAETTERDWRAAPLPDLLDHIVQVHHGYTKSALPLIRELMRKVVRAHGARHGEMLGQVDRRFLELQQDLGQHLMKEEQVLFPHILASARCRAEGGEEPGACFATVQDPIRQMEHEHAAAGELLREIRQFTGGYQLPDDACPTFAALYDELQRLEADLHQHIHLENNILFPRTLELEQRGCSH